MTAPSKPRDEAEGGPEPDVSVITVGRDVRPELEFCFAALEEHRGEITTEVFAVDNASADGTADWIRREHPGIHLIELAHNAFTAARIPALPRVRGRFTLFVDSDAYMTAGALPAMVAALEDNPGWGLVGPRLVYPEGDLQLSCRRFPPRAIPVMRRPPLNRWLEESAPVRRHQMEDIDHSIGRPVLYVLGACQLFRTSLLSRMGSPDRALGWGGADDVDWCIRVWDAGAEVRYLPEAEVIHAYRRITKAASPLSGKALRHLRAFGALQWKYRGRYRELQRFGEELDRRAVA
ncbi:MAG: glycosyltransferase family 2 protein [Solirubrobacterales bacterium]|nr:glycosyltransferase family 2 protein [Solirubrobacterales bacterium]